MRPDTRANTSYRQTLRSSSIIGGSSAVNNLLSLLRIKVVAILLGPAGVGIIGLYATVVSLIGTVAGIGLQGSAVRAVAGATGRSDPQAVARTIYVLRRLCWITGSLGWLAIAVLSIPLSRIMFESTAHASALAILGSTILLSAVSNGQLALLQGLRRIGDIARVQMMVALLNVIVAISLYAWLGDRGIVPVLVMSAAVSLSVSWWFSRRVHVAPVVLGWQASVAEAKPLLGLGVALTWSAVLVLAVDLLTRTLVSRELGVEASGHYQAAWALSGLFAGFVLTAMGMDFYPRLAAIGSDRVAARRAVNEQTEIGILLALPGILGTLALGKGVVWLFYSAEFAPAVDVLVWMLLGVFGRVLSWPLGYVQLALGAGRWFMVSETAFHAIQAAMVLWFVSRFGLLGAAYSFAAFYALHTLGMLWIARKCIGFCWSLASIKLIGVAIGFIAIAFAVNRTLTDWHAVAVGCAISIVGALFSIRGLVARLGNDHWLAGWVRKFSCMLNFEKV